MQAACTLQSLGSNTSSIACLHGSQKNCKKKVIIITVGPEIHAYCAALSITIKCNFILSFYQRLHSKRIKKERTIPVQVENSLPDIFHVIPNIKHVKY